LALMGKLVFTEFLWVGELSEAPSYKVNMTNTIEILQAMNKAEWTNRHPERPNPYE
jgi:hypothetical protein